jgi:ATP synthase protein I
MPQPDEESQEALRRLDQRLDAFDGQRASKPDAAAGVAERGVGEGYRLLGEVIGGVLGGLGLGWVADAFAHTVPIFTVVGLLLGTGLSAYMAVRGAERMNKAAAKRD